MITLKSLIILFASAMALIANFGNAYATCADTSANKANCKQCCDSTYTRTGLVSNNNRSSCKRECDRKHST